MITPPHEPALSEEFKSKYAAILNCLAEMQDSFVYAVRRGVLIDAAATIVRLGKDCDALHAAVAGLEMQVREARMDVLKLGQDREKAQAALILLQGWHDY